MLICVILQLMYYIVFFDRSEKLFTTTIGKTTMVPRTTGQIKDAVKYGGRLVENEMTDIKVSKNKHIYVSLMFINNKINNNINQQQLPSTTTI